MASTYTPATEDLTGSGIVHFQDVLINPATLHDGTLVQRFDTRKYPEKGVIADPAAGATVVTVTLNPATPAADQSTTLTATVAGVEGLVPQGTVQFKDGSGNVSTAQTLSGGAASLVVPGGFTAGAHSFTAVYSGDSKTPGATSGAVAVTVGADVTAPAPVTALVHSAETSSKITLTWVNPADLDFAGVMVRQAAGAVAPATHADGTLVADVAAPGVTVDATGLTAATQYSFAAFAHDGSGNYAAGVNTTDSTTA